MKKAMVAVLVAVFLTLGLLAGCESEEVTGSGNLETKDFNFSDFTRVEAHRAFEVEISPGDSYFVSITVNENLLERLAISQSGDTLIMDLEEGNYRRTTQKATITMLDLRGLRLSGASKATVSGFSFSHSVEFDLSGASSLDLDNLEAGNTEFDISGAGRISGSIKMANGQFDLSGASTAELAGSASDVSIEASGASKLRLGDFSMSNADTKLSGASSGTIQVNDRLDVDLSGASKLDYIGNPTMGTI